LIGSAAKLPVETTNKKTRTKMLVQVERDDIFFMAYLLLVKFVLSKVIFPLPLGERVRVRGK
jgi:hypothetical protein